LILKFTKLAFCISLQLAIPLVGRKEKGKLHCWASRSSPQDSWTIDKLDLEVKDRRWTFYIDPNSSSNDVAADTSDVAADQEITDRREEFVYTKLSAMKTSSVV
jgi:hypothetical protein